MSDYFDARRHMEVVLFPFLSGIFSSAACIEGHATQRSVETLVHQEENQNPIALDVSYTYATNTGLELELAYQDQLKAQEKGFHVITVGDYGNLGDALYIGDVPAAVKTLKQALQGEVLVLEYGKDFFSGEDILNFLAKKHEHTITSIHSFGHGDPMEYWLSLYPSDASLTVNTIKELPLAKKTAIKENFADDAVWKLYICHGAADRGNIQFDVLVPGENFAKTVAEVFGIRTIGSNSMVFLEEGSNTYMYPASRARYKQEFTVLKPDYPAEIPDLLYFGESAWVTYTLKAGFSTGVLPVVSLKNSQQVENQEERENRPEPEAWNLLQNSKSDNLDEVEIIFRRAYHQSERPKGVEIGGGRFSIDK